MTGSKQFARRATLALASLWSGAVINAAWASQNIRSFDCDTLNGVISKSGVSLDKGTFKTGKGALKLESTHPGKTVFRLYEVDKLNIENARIIYKAKVKSRNIKGKAYLEMWCHVPDKGEFFSRGLDQPLTGTNDWTAEEIPFLLKAGQKADQVKLNLVIEDTGTVWIDDIELSESDL